MEEIKKVALLGNRFPVIPIKTLLSDEQINSLKIIDSLPKNAISTLKIPETKTSGSGKAFIDGLYRRATSIVDGCVIVRFDKNSPKRIINRIAAKK